MDERTLHKYVDTNKSISKYINGRIQVKTWISFINFATMNWGENRGFLQNVLSQGLGAVIEVTAARITGKSSWNPACCMQSGQNIDSFSDKWFNYNLVRQTLCSNHKSSEIPIIYSRIGSKCFSTMETRFVYDCSGCRRSINKISFVHNPVSILQYHLVE